jgi:acyl-CoA reductase-like NAD-dependent aldehyde dehydrogenase
MLNHHRTDLNHWHGVGVVRDIVDDGGLVHLNHPLFGLTTSVFTDNAELQNRVIDAAQSGTVFINWCNDVHAEVAWSGWGHSGNSMPALSELGFEALTRTQSIVRAPAAR